MNFRCFAGCNTSVMSAAGGLAAKELPKTQDMFANVPVRWALRRCPYPKPCTLTCLCPGAFSASGPVLGQQKGFWGGNMRPRGFSRTAKQPQVEGGAGFQLPTHPHHCRATPPPSFSLLCSSLGCSLNPTALSCVFKPGLIFHGCFESKVWWGKPPEELSVLF